jgi:putative flippase GtrA
MGEFIRQITDTKRNRLLFLRWLDRNGRVPEDSLPRQSQHDHRALVTGHSSTRPRSAWEFGHKGRAFLVRLSQFLVVGGMGVLVNSLALLILSQWAHLPLVIASALSAELGMVNCYCWNDRWTFRRSHLSLSRFARFNVVNLGGLVITTITLWMLVRHLGVYYLAANLLGIGLATAWNFAANLRWTWGSRSDILRSVNTL